MTTLAQACKAIVTDAIDHDYLEGYDNNIGNVYRDEYGYNDTTPKACMSYLQGLPSVCTVPFDNDVILNILSHKIGGVDPSNDLACDELVDKYWQECGYQFWKMVR